jgi:hypothetical protein
MIGKTASHHRTLEHLGQGGMGEGFLTYDTSLDRNGASEFHLIFAPLITNICRYFDHKVSLLASLNNENLKLECFPEIVRISPNITAEISRLKTKGNA